MSKEKIKELLKLLEGLKYYEWKRLSNVVERKYETESQTVVINETIKDSESLEKTLLLEFDLHGNNLN